VLGKVGVIGGLVLVVLGTLTTVGVFFLLPWFEDTASTGFDAVSLAPVQDPLLAVWGLVPLAALVLLGLGVLSGAMTMFGGRLSPALFRVVSLIPLLLVLAGLCGCGPLAMDLLAPFWDPGVGSFDKVIATKGYGFWSAAAGLGVATVGALVMLIGGLMSRRRAASY
jgi:hypothetical protein